MHTLSWFGCKNLVLVTALITIVSDPRAALAQNGDNEPSQITKVTKTKKDLACPSNRRFIIEHWQGDTLVRVENGQCVPR